MCAIPAGRLRDERGAVILQVAFALVALTVMSGLAVDLGVLWVARTQVQASADAAAIAGASLLSCNNGLPKKRDEVAKDAAVFATINEVWGKKPKANEQDVTFPTCPDGTATCVRANVFRDPPAGKPLPTIFMRLVGVNEQGVRGTATAQLLPVGANDCVRPFALADRWIERHPVAAPWTPDATFEKYDKNGKLLPTPDVFVAPGPSGPGTGHTLPEACGMRVTIREVKDWKDPARFANYLSVIVPRTDGANGAVGFRANIAGCNGVPLPVTGGTLQVKPGQMIGPTREGLAELFAQDPNAYWDAKTMTIKGGCMAAGTCSVSPRLVTLPLYDPEHYSENRSAGGVEVRITNYMGFFMESHQDTEIVGYVTTAAAIPRNTTALTYRSAFLNASVLIR